MGINRAKRRARRAAKRAAFSATTQIGRKDRIGHALKKSTKGRTVKKLPPGEARGARDLQLWSKQRKAER
jgi:hypothetical protein